MEESLKPISRNVRTLTGRNSQKSASHSFYVVIQVILYGNLRCTEESREPISRNVRTLTGRIFQKSTSQLFYIVI